MFYFENDNKNSFCFYFIIDSDSKNLSVLDQVRIAIKSGASIIQYRNKNFNLDNYDEVCLINSVCFKNGVFFVINDDIALAKAVGADGVHLGQKDDKIKLARKILGFNVLIGLSVSSFRELKVSNLKICDYIGVGPVFYTETKNNVSFPHGVSVLNKIVNNSSVPIIAIGGINSKKVVLCMEAGVEGVAVISAITRTENPVYYSKRLASKLWI